MKKQHLQKLALAGMVSGTLLASQSSVDAQAPFSMSQETNSLDMSLLLAKPACKGSSGCGGSTPPEEVLHKKPSADQQGKNGENTPAHSASGKSHSNNSSGQQQSQV